MPRIAVVEREKCNPIGCGNYLCARLCPVNRKGTDCIVVDPVTKKAKVYEDVCIGCGICVNRCPFDAITIVNLPEELAKRPIHRYGRNGFHLYNLPTPLFGKVVGIVGVNGIGKTTAIKILAGVLKPNFGEEETEELSEEEKYNKLIEFFKGTEAQVFFEKIKNKEIVISYKPQQIDLIPKQYKGKIIDLLKKVNQKEQKEFDEIIEKLALKEILDNEIDKISGGELQRVAIAATILKKANLYIFDEPASYLDIKQRIRVSRIIREMCDENTAIVLIEHDLLILDYMTDLVHIMYGKESVYGVVAHPRTTRVCLNTYLSGYMRDENIRFRDHEIKFLAKPPEIKEIHGEEQVSWQNIKKRLGHFTLEAEKGAIYKKDVIGVIGENGIGKTTFAKILAKVLEPDSGETKENVVISYKPQQLEVSDEIVMNVLGERYEKYENQLMNPLHIKPLLTRKLNEISGGELQRVAIANCLSQKADLYLLDEPSAYLDIEQRLRLTKLLAELMQQKGTSCLVIDHDLIFVDYLAQKLIVFDGEPAIKGIVKGPYSMQDGMNEFLRDMMISMRRDPDSLRPRINKPGSQKDREQKAKNKLYYA